MVSMTAAAVAICAGNGACATTASPRQLTQAVKQFLVDHGDLCVAKYTWPRNVTAADEQAGTDDAIQLPVLERLGLVRSADIPVPAAAGPQAHGRRYSLTALGRKYYLRRQRVTLGAHDRPVQHTGDFCVARLSLDKVIKWTAPAPAHGHLETVVKYTYHIKPAVWMADPGAQRVFPVIARLIQGEGRLEMTATVQLQGHTWVSVLPGQ